MALMNKYIIWTSPNTGEYVKADRVEEHLDLILFLHSTPEGTFKLICTYPKQYEYHEVEL